MSEPTAQERMLERTRDIEITPYTSPELIRAIRAARGEPERSPKRSPRWWLVAVVLAAIPAAVFVLVLLS